MSAKTIAGEAYNFVRERLTQKDNCRVFLQQIEMPLERKRRGTVGVQRRSECGSAFEDRTTAGCLNQAPFAKTHRVLRFGRARRSLKHVSPGRSKSGDEWQASVAPMDTALRIASLYDMRRGYAERFEAQKKAQQSGEAIFRLIDNPRFDGSAPAISVIVTLYNYRGYIQECLKSLEDSETAAIPGGIEIVVVNDASTDDSLKQAIAWQGNSRHPVRIVDKRFNTGPGGCAQHRPSAGARALCIHPGRR